jgi:hypothetical protein
MFGGWTVLTSISERSSTSGWVVGGDRRELPDHSTAEAQGGMRRGRVGTFPQDVDGRHRIGSLRYLPSNSLRSGWMPNGRGLPLVEPGHTVRCGIRAGVSPNASCDCVTQTPKAASGPPVDGCQTSGGSRWSTPATLWRPRHTMQGVQRYPPRFRCDADTWMIFRWNWVALRSLGAEGAASCRCATRPCGGRVTRHPREGMPPGCRPDALFRGFAQSGSNPGHAGLCDRLRIAVGLYPGSWAITCRSGGSRICSRPATR